MLHVTHAPKPVSESSPLAAILWAGALLGTVVIPLYALGYSKVARLVRPHSSKLGWFLAISGTGTAVSFAWVHVFTALVISESLVPAVAGVEPEGLTFFQAGLAIGLIPATVFVTTVSIAIFVAASTRVRALPRWLALLNPAAATIVLALVALPLEIGRMFLLPSAPNLAHLAFFASALAVPGLTRKHPPSGVPPAPAVHLTKKAGYHVRGCLRNATRLATGRRTTAGEPRPAHADHRPTR